MVATFSPTAGRILIRVDDTTVMDVQGVTEPGSMIDTLIIGISSAPAQSGTLDVYFDDVVIAAQPIGCT